MTMRAFRFSPLLHYTIQYWLEIAHKDAVSTTYPRMLVKAVLSCQQPPGRFLKLNDDDTGLYSVLSEEEAVTWATEYVLERYPPPPPTPTPIETAAQKVQAVAGDANRTVRS